MLWRDRWMFYNVMHLRNHYRCPSDICILPTYSCKYRDPFPFMCALQLAPAKAFDPKLSDFKLIYDVVNTYSLTRLCIKIESDLLVANSFYSSYDYHKPAHVLGWGVVMVITLFPLASHGVVNMTDLGATGEWRMVTLRASGVCTWDFCIRSL